MAKTTKQPVDVDYSALSGELAELMTRLEQADLDVDAAVEAYARGLQIISILEDHLLKAENRVTELRAAGPQLTGDEEA